MVTDSTVTAVYDISTNNFSGATPRQPAARPMWRLFIPAFLRSGMVVSGSQFPQA